MCFGILLFFHTYNHFPYFLAGTFNPTASGATQINIGLAPQQTQNQDP